MITAGPISESGITNQITPGGVLVGNKYLGSLSYLAFDVKRFKFSELFDEDYSKSEIINTFLALLEVFLLLLLLLDFLLIFFTSFNYNFTNWLESLTIFF